MVTSKIAINWVAVALNRKKQFYADLQAIQ